MDKIFSDELNYSSQTENQKLLILLKYRMRQKNVNLTKRCTHRIKTRQRREDDSKACLEVKVGRKDNVTILVIRS